MALQNSLLPIAQDSTQTLPPSVARDLTNTDIQRIQGSLDHSVSDNTRAMYASEWRAFQTWTRAPGVLAMPASTSLVAAYLAHLAEERRLSMATIRLHRPPWPAGTSPLATRPHRQRRGQKSDAGHLQNPWQIPALGETPDRPGPGGRQGHREEPARPGHRRKTSGIG